MEGSCEFRPKDMRANRSVELRKARRLSIIFICKVMFQIYYVENIYVFANMC